MPARVGTLSSEVADAPQPQVHRIGAHVNCAEHGLDAYWGLVSAFEPGDEGTTVTALDGETFVVETANHWRGQLVRPGGEHEDGLYEYQYEVWSDDEHGRRGFDVRLRPGFPDAQHAETGEPIQGLPQDCPESIRLQIESVNLERAEIMQLLQALAEAVGWNPRYVETAHDWSRIYALETYARLDRDLAAGRIVGTGGVLEDLSQFGQGNGQGEHKWDHEETTGHYESVALDPGTWSQLIDSQTLPKRLKCYQPQHPRVEDDGDPLYHHKVECQYWADYDSESIPWSGYEQAVGELEETVLNALHWGDVPIEADATVSDGKGGARDVFVADDYWTPTVREEPVEIAADPIPALAEQERHDAVADVVDPDATPAEFDVLEVVTDGGRVDYEEVAERAGRSTSTVYRAIQQFDSILDTDNGAVGFVDDVVRSTVGDIVEQFAAARDATETALEQVAERARPLSRSEDGEPSALERWINRHGIRVTQTYDQLEFEVPQAMSEYEMLHLVRAGLDAAERSPLLTERFEGALFTWTDRDEGRKSGYQAVVGGRILGIDPV